MLPLKAGSLQYGCKWANIDQVIEYDPAYGLWQEARHLELVIGTAPGFLVPRDIADAAVIEADPA